MAAARPLARGTRILHLDSGRSWRGGQQQVLLLHRELERLGLESGVLARSGGELARRLHRPGGGPAATLGHPWSPLTVAAVRRALRGARLVHAHDPHAAGLAALAGGGAGGPPLVCHRRVSYPLHHGPLHRLKYRRVDRWIAVGPAAERALLEGGVPPGRIRVVASAIDLDGFRRAAAAADLDGLRRELRLEASTPVIGLTGALERQKGHRVLLEGGRRIVDAHPDAVFLWAGEGRMRRELERAVAGAGLAGRVRLLGFRRDVAALTALCTVAVVPSLDGEGSPAVLREAMALGRPLVASALAGNRDVVADAGLLVPVGDSGALAEAVVGLLANPALRRDLGDRGRRRVELFRPERMASAVAVVYGELLGRGAR